MTCQTSKLVQKFCFQKTMQGISDDILTIFANFCFKLNGTLSYQCGKLFVTHFSEILIRFGYFSNTAFYNLFYHFPCNGCKPLDGVLSSIQTNYNVNIRKAENQKERSECSQINVDCHEVVFKKLSLIAAGKQYHFSTLLYVVKLWYDFTFCQAKTKHSDVLVKREKRRSFISKFRWTIILQTQQFTNRQLNFKLSYI